MAPFGRRAFIAGAAGAVAATALSSTASAAVPANASYFEPVGPVRLADTRTEAPHTNVAKIFQRLSDRVIRIDIRNSPYVTIPNAHEVTAVVVGLVGIFNGQHGWVQAVPSGNTTIVSNINMEPGDGAVANMATVRVGTDGKIDVRGLNPYHMIVDILGVYRSTSVAVRKGRLKFLPQTKRALANTRVDGARITVPIPFVPASAQAVVVNLTSAGARRGGHFTAMATGTVGIPNVSNLNYAVGDTRAGAAIVKLGPNAVNTPSIDVFSHGDTQVYVDVTGYITGDGDVVSDVGLFVPIDPFRVMDTRRARDVALTGKSRLWPRWSRVFELPNGTNGFGLRSQMSGVAMNATIVGAMNYGFVTVLPAQTYIDDVSNLNVTRIGHVVANHVTSQASLKGIEMFCLCGGDLLADIAGWYTGSPTASTKPAPTADPAPPVAAFNYILNVPRMGVNNWVIPSVSNPDSIVDGGNTWHWTGTGQLGADGAAVVVFGHRTSKGGPYRNQHLLTSGDLLTLDTPDQRRYTYRYAGERLTNHQGSQILNAARTIAAGTTFSLVACTGRGTPQNPGVLNDQPLGGIAWRIVSTFTLVNWVDAAPRSNE